MSQQQQTVRITTTTTSSSSHLIINTGYLKTWPGLLKLAQFVNIFLFSKNRNQLTSSQSIELTIFCFSVSFSICSRTWWLIRSSLFRLLLYRLYLRHAIGHTINSKVLGCICVGIIAYYFNDKRRSPPSELFFYLMVVTFLICTTILLISCLFSWSTGGIISKTIYVSRKHTWNARDRMDYEFSAIHFVFVLCFSSKKGIDLSFGGRCIDTYRIDRIACGH